MNSTKQNTPKVNALNQIIDNLQQCDIGTPITNIYALVDTVAAEVSAVTLDASHPEGGYEESLPLAGEVNYLIIAVGDIQAQPGIHTPT